MLRETCFKYDISLRASHVPRKHNVAADHLSKHRVEQFKEIFPNTFDNPKKIKKLLFYLPLTNVDVREETGRTYHNIEYPSDKQIVDQAIGFPLKDDSETLSAKILDEGKLTTTNTHQTHGNSHDSTADLSEKSDTLDSLKDQSAPMYLPSGESQNVTCVTNYNLPTSNQDLLQPFSRHKQSSPTDDLRMSIVKKNVKDSCETDRTNSEIDNPQNSDNSESS